MRDENELELLKKKKKIWAWLSTAGWRLIFFKLKALGLGVARAIFNFLMRTVKGYCIDWNSFYWFSLKIKSDFFWESIKVLCKKELLYLISLKIYVIFIKINGVHLKVRYKIVRMLAHKNSNYFFSWSSIHVIRKL